MEFMLQRALSREVVILNITAFILVAALYWSPIVWTVNVVFGLSAPLWLVGVFGVLVTAVVGMLDTIFMKTKP